MIDRKEYMESPFGQGFHDEENPRGMPDFLVKEAGAEYDWEALAKRDLENSAFARDFKRVFPAESFGGIYKIDSKSGGKTLVKSSEAVMQEAYVWLEKKFKGDVRKARAVLDATGLVDEFVTGIMLNFGEGALEASEKEFEKNTSDNDGQPYLLMDERREEETTAESAEQDSILTRMEKTKAQTRKAGLHRSKKVGEYGILVDDQEMQLWKKGKLLSSIGVEDLGGFHIAAEEVESLETEADVNALFNVEAEQPVETKASLVGKKAVFASGEAKMSGSIVAVLDGQASVSVDGMDVEVSMPVESLKVVNAACCVEQAKEGRGKFCLECGSSI